MQSSIASQSVPAPRFLEPLAAPISDGIAPSLRKYAWFVLGWNITVVLWGAIVRATGSGAGCGNHWPLCNGEVFPTSPRIATMIEFTHRAMTGGATFTILALLIWTFRATKGRHLARITAVASTLLLLNEAFLGALLVKLGYVVNNQSLGRFIVLPIHLANTLLLLGALTLTAHFLSRDSGFMDGSVEYRYFGLTLIGLGSTIAVGVTGSLAALGDTLFPNATFAQDFAQSSPWILRLRWMHPAASLLAGIFVLGLIWASSARGSATNRQLANTVIGLLLFQFALGGLDVLLRAPTWMQILHLLGADVFWATLVVLTARLSVVPLGCPGSTCRLRAGR
ncbi:Heme A synthase, cytochrome oxidase biogenesis protein Cox15-CtaA [Acidisarcina polymorpha]|uniref:Heme A synthase, cytochrome oxidase biogenesis protein Cox15-CtaA n=1 Tax=Acidisarcina polymorpha TaxID=2211140 RepID=A0A2Z5FXI8_9BACT|nr:COX15/CtaA family protein [Acidisarcina polymorpha]AXC11593.1 Heme A synthase, cytochrome oxidase biogenesis protein Cox15-CtaA [Acidisarcina polymorpha]